MPANQRVSHVYNMASGFHRIYVGKTNNLLRRVYEHRNHLIPGFTAKYNMTRWVYFEDYPTALDAIRREKQPKGWLRSRKIALIQEANPKWDDLAASWYDDEPLDVRGNVAADSGFG